MMPWILGPADTFDSPFAGGKARALARAERAGLPVPAWFVLSACAFTDSLTPEQYASFESAADETTLARSLDVVCLRAGIEEALERAVRELCPNGETVAVRSSASDEDGAQHSFAGQLESFLNVAPGDVPDRVRAVWRSAFTARILAYRRERGLPPLPTPPAVLIQRMVQPRAAGVAFSADPVSGRRGVAVVSATPGLGSALVGGEADADTWWVHRNGAIIERRTVSKPALSDEEVLAVASLARAAARHFGQPQDIEWACPERAVDRASRRAVADRLVLLQSRPITSLGAMPDPDACLVIWDNSNIVESYSGVISPLTFSFAQEIYEHVYRQFCRMMGVPGRLIAQHDETFRNMLGLVRGRLYYNLLNWYRMLALLPGYRVNRSFMEQMMGVKEPLPACLADEVAKSVRRGRALDGLRVARTVGGLVVNYFTLDRRVDAFHTRLDDALAPPIPPLEDRRPDELVAHYRDLRGRLLLRWQAPLVNDFYAMIFYGLLRRLVMRWCGDRAGTLQNDLISGEGGIVSAEPAVRMQRLARLAARTPALLDRLTAGSTEEILARLDDDPEFGDEYHAYLAKFGDRTVNELKLESATLHDEPLPLLRAVGALGRQIADAGGADSSDNTSSSGDRLRTEAHQRVADAFANRPLRRAVFQWVLQQARRRVRDRENLRLGRTRLFGRVRRIFLELGRRLHAVDLLDDPRDVLYLEVDEVVAFVDGRSTCTDLRSLARLRRGEFCQYEEGSAPDDRFETRGPVYHGHDFRQGDSPLRGTGALRGLSPSPTDDERRGLGCSPGVVRGRVRVVRDPRNADLRERAILVAEHTDPGWIIVFPSALGVLVERGSLLSHAAIVARELGIPAVVSVPGVTRWLKDDDWVEMDGRTGVIRRIPAPEVREPTTARVARVASYA